jgi:transcription initiation factor TFIIIB Brf1 subunit/transcription initiation factor TFIIB
MQSNKITWDDIKCPKCNGVDFKIEKRIDGNMTCMECGFVGKQKEFLPKEKSKSAECNKVDYDLLVRYYSQLVQLKQEQIDIGPSKESLTIDELEIVVIKKIKRQRKKMGLEVDERLEPKTKV